MGSRTLKLGDFLLSKVFIASLKRLTPQQTDSDKIKKWQHLVLTFFVIKKHEAVLLLVQRKQNPLCMCSKEYGNGDLLKGKENKAVYLMLSPNELTTRANGLMHLRNWLPKQLEKTKSSRPALTKSHWHFPGTLKKSAKTKITKNSSLPYCI